MNNFKPTFITTRNKLEARNIHGHSRSILLRVKSCCYNFPQNFIGLRIGIFSVKNILLTSHFYSNNFFRQLNIFRLVFCRKCPTSRFSPSKKFNNIEDRNLGGLALNSLFPRQKSSPGKVSSFNKIVDATW